MVSHIFEVHSKEKIPYFTCRICRQGSSTTNCLDTLEGHVHSDRRKTKNDSGSVEIAWFNWSLGTAKDSRKNNLEAAPLGKHDDEFCFQKGKGVGIVFWKWFFIYKYVHIYIIYYLYIYIYSHIFTFFGWNSTVRMTGEQTELFGWMNLRKLMGLVTDERSGFPFGGP